ncbi:hypothetical protein [Desulfosporosinus nitroreducens]|uniref:Uncharacterized protein n=1 Tax=Desulfosporosinus nitroreducens TaxID=2018668 RepID=A0ABT8QUV6_9FIRM|nr:hypothetical protein [Desulfosporosinus nitroreducens]MDO0824642.1 hypothetical protein [Desulfosporosinus nitroreducens]
MRNLFILGKTTSFRAITILFYMGLIPLIVPSYFLGNFIYLTNTYFEEVQSIYNGQPILSFQDINNAPLGVLGGVVTFVVLSILWKVLCELLIILFRYFESNTQNGI